MSRQRLDEALSLVGTAIRSDLDIPTLDHIMSRLSDLNVVARDKREKIDRGIMNSFDDPVIAKAYLRLCHVITLRNFKKEGITESVMKNQIKELRDMDQRTFQKFLDALSQRKWRLRHSNEGRTGRPSWRWFQPHVDRVVIDDFDY